jgi:hypothetical protein
VPARVVDAFLIAHLQCLIYSYEQLEQIPPKIYLLCDAHGGFEETPLAGYVEIIRQSGSVFEKFVRASFEIRYYEYVVFSTSDDITLFDVRDIQAMHERRAKVGVGNFLLCRPAPNSSFRIFRGWTHFSQYMGTPPSTERLETYVKEGPHTVWACYEAGYFNELGAVVSNLLELLSSDEENLIEDIINVMNLMANDFYCKNSVSLRFMEGNYSSKASFVPSWEALRRVAITGRLGPISLVIKNQMKRMCRPDNGITLLSVNQIVEALQGHCDGYRTARSRKWREWIDVDWRPFAAPQTGVAPSTDSLNPYQNAFLWAGRADICEAFPRFAWMSEDRLRRFVEGIPNEVWAFHEVTQ